MSSFIRILCLALAAGGCSGAFAGLCESGQQQSPIDIRMAKRQTLPALQFDYHTVPLNLVNDGHTVRLRFTKGNTLRIGNDRYILQQYHFHTPGGDKLAGEEFPMAAHLLHKSQHGQLLAVVVLLRIGKENPLLQALLPQIPAAKGEARVQAETLLDANLLLPVARGYFRYSGSLTAAPCTEGVDWIVMKEPLELAPGQLARYRQLFADNARSVQPLNRRVVMESQ